MVKNPPANAGDMGSNPGSGRLPVAENRNPLQYSCLGNPMDRGAWWGVKRVRHDLVTNQQLLESLAEAQGSHEVWGGKVEATQTPDNLRGGQDCSLFDGAMARAERKAGANQEACPLRDPPTFLLRVDLQFHSLQAGLRQRGLNQLIAAARGEISITPSSRGCQVICE